MSVQNKTSAKASAKATVGQSLPGYGIMAAGIAALEGFHWMHLVLAGIPAIDALVTYLRRLKVPYAGTVAEYLDAVENIVATDGDGDLTTDVDRAEGA